MYKRYIFRLTDEERGRIAELVRRGGAHARSLLYARILLKADTSEGGPAWTDERIADALEPAPTRWPERGGASWRTGWR